MPQETQEIYIYIYVLYIESLGERMYNMLKIVITFLTNLKFLLFTWSLYTDNQTNSSNYYNKEDVATYTKFAADIHH